MTEFQQQNSLLTDMADVPIAGAGASTAEAPAGGTGYYAWSWEQILATVLAIGIPDRTEVTGQPWTVIQHAGQADAGLHLIWTAQWNTSPNAGATSIQVYLNPALYSAGGAWDRFLNAPAQALSGVASGSFGALPLAPPSFQAASLAVAGVTTFLDSAAQQFSSMHLEATSPSSGFQGSAADVVAQLLDGLRSAMTSLHGQMTSPVAYSDAIGTAGDSAAKLLSDISAAQVGWTQVPEHSPLGALVQVLEEIAAPGGGEISDPQQTPFGDLTTDAAWQQVEQAAKNRWTGTLLGGSPDFTGLDVLGRVALGKLVEQYASTTSSVVPVIGPARPAPQVNNIGVQNQPGAGSGSAGSGSNGVARVVVPGPAPTGSGPTGSALTGPPLSGPPLSGSGPTGSALSGPPLSGPPLTGPPLTGPPLTGPPLSGPPLTGATVAGLGLTGTGLPGLDVTSAAVAGPGLGQGLTGGSARRLPLTGPMPPVLGVTGAAIAGPALIGSALTSPASDTPFGLDAGRVTPVITTFTQVPPVSELGVQPGGISLEATGTPGEQADGALAAGLLATTGGVVTTPGGVLGDSDALVTVSGELPTAEASATATGMLGSLPAADGFTGTLGRRDRGAARDRGSSGRQERTHRRRTAPSAGFSLGRHANGSVLEQSAIPVIDGGPRSSAVTSSTLNTLNAQVIPGGPGGPGGPGAGMSAHGLAGTGPIDRLQGGGEAIPGARMITDPGMALGRDTAFGGQPMLMSGSGMGGCARSDQERERLAYLPEDEEYWGTEPDLPDVSVSSGDQGESREPEHGTGPVTAIGIGADGSVLGEFAASEGITR